MPSFLSRFYHVSVLNLRQDTVEAHAHYLDRQYEVLVQLMVGSIDYKVRKAQVEVMRHPAGKDSHVKKILAELVDMLAYKGVAKKVLAATAEDHTGIWAGLLFECVKALRQARAFIWEQTGFDPLPLRALIERDFKDSCIYFTTPESINTILDPKQLKEQTRTDLLFARYRYCFLTEADGLTSVTAGLSDSYHEMKLTTGIRQGRVISSAAQILRAPEEICFQTADKALNLLNNSLSDAPAQWEKDLLGPASCTHLGDLAREILSSINYWQNTDQFILPLSSD